MRDAQFVFVTEDARVLAVLMDGSLEDVTEARELLPTPGLQPRRDRLLERKRALMLKFAA